MRGKLLFQNIRIHLFYNFKSQGKVKDKEPFKMFSESGPDLLIQIMNFNASNTPRPTRDGKFGFDLLSIRYSAFSEAMAM